MRHCGPHEGAGSQEKRAGLQEGQGMGGPGSREECRPGEGAQDMSPCPTSTTLLIQVTLGHNVHQNPPGPSAKKEAGKISRARL